MKNNNEFILKFCKSVKDYIKDYVVSAYIEEHTPKILIHASYIAGVYGTMVCMSKQYEIDNNYCLLKGYMDTAKSYYHMVQNLANDYMESFKNNKGGNDNE